MVLLLKTLKGNVLYHNSPDGGWAWVVLCAGFFIMAIIFSAARGIGIFYNDFMDHYNVTNSQISWIYSIALSMIGIAAPLGTMLLTYISSRKILILSGILCCLGMVIAAIATRIWMVYMGIGFIWGCGYCWSYICVYIQVTMYFSRWRGFVNGLLVCGGAVGATLMPLGFQQLNVLLGWRGTLFIMAGIELNICVFAALIRPISIVSKADISKYRDLPYADRQTNVDQLRKMTVSSEVLDYVHQAECQGYITPAESCSEKIGIFIKDNWLLSLYILAQFSVGIALLIPGMYIVPFSKDVGCTDQQAALLLSMSSVGDIVFRPLSGTIISCIPRLEKKLLYLLAILFLLHAAISFLPILDNEFLTLSAYVILYGCLYGSIITCNATSMAFLLGKENITKYIGRIFFVSGVSVLVSPPLAGYLVDISGTYITALWYTMAGSLFSSALFFVVGVCFGCTSTILPKYSV